MRILLVEDEVKIANAIAYMLKQENFQVDIAHDGESGLNLAYDGIYNALIVDWMLPDLDGFSLVKSLRSIHDATPILMLTARDSIQDKVAALNNGADDYLTKPFDKDELIARVNALLRRPPVHTNAQVFVLGNMHFDYAVGIIMNENTKKMIQLSQKEQYVLEYLLSNKNITLSKEQILDKVWGSEAAVDVDNVDLYIYYLRKKISSIAVKVEILTVRGVGFCIKEMNNGKEITQ